jgi:hypothetical protein
MTALDVLLRMTALDVLLRMTAPDVLLVAPDSSRRHRVASVERIEVKRC